MNTSGVSDVRMTTREPDSAASVNAASSSVIITSEPKFSGGACRAMRVTSSDGLVVRTRSDMSAALRVAS
jgi:hypothetical protein